MHGGIWHLFFNMYTLWIFGSILENVWGSKKFLLFYFVTGLGAALLHNLVLEIELSTLQNAVQSGNMAAQTSIMNILRTPTVGASGAIYGVLLGYGMLFPNNIISLIFPPIALKAKWFVIIFGAIELLMGVTGTGSDVAHFAHLGGMIFGWLLILWWRHRGYEGFDSTPWSDGRLKQWFKEKWNKLFPKRPPRIKRDDDSKDYRDYHYHKPL